MGKLLSILKQFKNSFWFIVVFVLLIVIQFKNGTIGHLREEVAAKPKVEYIYKDSIHYIHDTIPEPYEVVKWKEKVVIEEQDGTIVQLTDADSVRIAQAYINLYYDFNETKIYDDVLMDSDTAYIGLYEEVFRNSVQNRKVTFIDKTPVVQITNTITKQDKTLSFVGGIDASIGTNFNSLSLGAGFVTSSNRVYLFKYDPVNQGFGGAIYFPIYSKKWQ